MKKETVIDARANVPVFFFNLIKKRNLTIRGFVKYAAAFYKA